MAEYKSNPVTVRKSADQIFDTLTDLQGLAEKITGIPADSVPKTSLIREFIGGGCYHV